MAPDVEELISQYIDPESTVAGPAEARIAGVHVWALIGYLRVNGDQADQAAADYDLPLEAIEAARAYYLRHRAAIDARLTLHASFFGSPTTAT